MRNTTPTVLVRRGSGKAIHRATLNSKAEPIGTWCATDVLAGGAKDSGVTVVDADAVTCKSCLRVAAQVQQPEVPHVEVASDTATPTKRTSKSTPKDTDAPKGTGSTATKGKGSKAAEKPATAQDGVKPSEAKRAAKDASATGVVKRVAPQLVEYTVGRKVDRELVSALGKGVTDRDGGVWIAVDVETCERLLAFARAATDDKDSTVSVRRTSAALIRRIESYTLPEARKAVNA